MRLKVIILGFASTVFYYNAIESYLNYEPHVAKTTNMFPGLQKTLDANEECLKTPLMYYVASGPCAKFRELIESEDISFALKSNHVTINDYRNSDEFNHGLWMMLRYELLTAKPGQIPDLTNDRRYMDLGRYCRNEGTNANNLEACLKYNQMAKYLYN